MEFSPAKETCAKVIRKEIMIREVNTFSLIKLIFRGGIILITYWVNASNALKKIKADLKGELDSKAEFHKTVSSPRHFGNELNAHFGHR